MKGKTIEQIAREEFTDWFVNWLMYGDISLCSTCKHYRNVDHRACSMFRYGQMKCNKWEQKK